MADLETAAAEQPQAQEPGQQQAAAPAPDPATPQPAPAGAAGGGEERKRPLEQAAGGGGETIQLKASSVLRLVQQWQIATVQMVSAGWWLLSHPEHDVCGCCCIPY